MSIKHNKYVVDQKLEYVDDISYRELFGRWFFFAKEKKICPFLAQGFVSTLTILFGPTPCPST
jgi:TfoX/Sxy family transcriptional regulator of competence genes